MLFFQTGGLNILYMFVILMFTIFLTSSYLFLVLFSTIMIVVMFFFFFILNNYFFLGFLMVLLYLGGLLMLFSYSAMLNGVKMMEGLNEMNGFFIFLGVLLFSFYKILMKFWPVLSNSGNMGYISNLSLFSSNFFFLFVGLFLLAVFLVLSIFFSLEKVYLSIILK
uniref:NADH dehydrogenase subunit 6 n=1 Tax=Ciona savignyi TaxID=51511 RepID=Q85UI1_CIOSA|nr:NADH dehydrogenase subunit 6 [Ciona savignyi]BAC57002.1 NADH dehydrogenase subunit 6 [Ciona savignyi]